MDGPPAQSLGVEPVHDKVLNAKPRKSGDPIITRALLIRALSSAFLIVYLTLKVFANELGKCVCFFSCLPYVPNMYSNSILLLNCATKIDDGQVTRRDTTMTFMTFVNCDLFNAYACRSSNRCFYELNFFSNPPFLWAICFSFIGQLLVVYFEPLQEVFQTEALSVYDLAYVMVLSSCVLMLDTLRKKYFLSFCVDAVGQEKSAKVYTDFQGKKIGYESEEDPPVCKRT